MMAIFSLLVGNGVSAQATGKASIILVPGAFHQEIVYDQVVELLHQQQYPHVFAVDLPSVGSMAGRNEDVTAVRNILSRELNQSRNVVLVGNSYGGTVIGEAVKGFPSNNTASTASGNSGQGKVLGLVFFAGISPSFFRFTDDGKVYADGDSALPPSVTFYNDLTAAQQAYWTSQLQYSSFDSLNATATYIPYTGDFRCHYIIGQRDVSVPEALAYSYINQTGAQFEVQWIDAGHIPMIGKPNEVTNIIRKAAGEVF
ncbi:alpha/beta-hydrolase [Westerdykella ornata]|uniref:Alpha/beta-hydrolase n=1 Tax=Westerdykella ornata TaxID=318751 RepID=A0A6A6JPB9_WESOR|nr:alpha/beta-hydrolase [Westerdykella ornata]KAF2278500.1 alpha/beta-hydrolase [Westerdykella ornata]